jgi:hypothetical protein
MRTKPILAAVGVLVGLALFYLMGATAHWNAMKRAHRYNAELLFETAFLHYQSHGTVTNPLPSRVDIFASTNRIAVTGTNYNCVLGFKWKNSAELLFVTKAGNFIWSEGGKPPQLSPRRSRMVPGSENQQ